MSQYGPPKVKIPFTPQQIAIGLGAAGAIGVGSMAYEHLRVEGIDDDERRKMLLFVATVGAAGVLIFGLGVRKEYVVLDEDGIEFWKKKAREQGLIGP